MADEPAGLPPVQAGAPQQSAAIFARSAGRPANPADLAALREAISGASRTSFTAWAGYLFVFWYLWLAAAGVTPRDLFFATPVRLPLADATVPLVGFFWLAPAVFLAVHACLLVHFAMLAGQVRLFDAELRAQVEDERERNRRRRELPIDLVIQLIGGPPELRDGVIGLLLWLLALIGLVLAPLALLLLFQLQFLPYHDAAVTWWQRIAVAIDIVLLLKLWPKIGSPEVERLPSGMPHHRGLVEGLQQLGTAASVLLILAVLPFAAVVATMPGEWAEITSRAVPQLASLRRALVAGDVDEVTQATTSPWADRLVLPGLQTHQGGDAASGAADVPALRGRHLEGAILVGASLRGVDLTGAHLEAASLRSADLREAVLDGARLQGAILTGARLSGAKLSGARLQGAYLNDAHLEGARLSEAQLAGAFLGYAHLEGATLANAQLQAANLDYAQLQGAFLDNAMLQGASLRHARLDGAVLDHAQLQGALLDGAHLNSASLRNVFVWRAVFGNADVSDARVMAIEPGAKLLAAPNKIAEWSPGALASLRGSIERESGRSGFAAGALRRLDRLDPAVVMTDEKQLAEQWSRLQSPTPTEAYEAKLAAVWQRLGCSGEAAPQVLTSLVRILTSPRSPFVGNSAAVPPLAADFLKAECAGAAGLPDDLKARLKGPPDRPAQASATADAPAAEQH